MRAAIEGAAKFDARPPCNRSAFAKLLGSAVPATLGLAILGAHPAEAQCVPFGGPVIPSDTIETCSGTTSGRIGQGPGADNVTVNVNDGATLGVTNDNAISLGNNATITVGSPSGSATALVQTTTNGGATGGQYGKGDNTVEFNNNSTIIIYQNGQVVASGTQQTSEAINPIGSGNTILNYGLIKAGASSAIFFENVNTSSSSPINVVDNYGTIDARGGNNPVTGGEAIGSFNNVGIHITNETGAFIYGNLDLQGGNDVVTLLTQSVITGNLNGGGGTNVLNLDAAAGDSDSLPGVVQNFQSLNKTGSGTWTLTGSVGQSSGAPLAVTVQGGTLVLTGNNANFNGSVLIDPGATLEARAQSLPPSINDLNGDLLINQVSPDGVQPNDGTYAGTIQGSGIVTKIGVGTVTLSGANTYSGGTVFDQGAVAVGADSALGAATGPLTFNGGALQFLSSFNLSQSRAITLQSGGGTLDANGYQTTVSQAISGPGGLTIASSAPGGVVTLTAANTYSGGTTISGGTLQLGAGGTTGSILGNVLDNGALVFDRSDLISFGGVVSGTGSLTQMGSGVLTLTGANTYSGGTYFNAGVLAAGADSALGAATGPLTFNGGALQFLSSFNLSQSRAITLQSGGGTLDANGYQTTVSQAISGPGGLTVASTAPGGVVTLTAANTYAGGTTISGGTLRLGAGGTTGSILGNVVDNGTLAFDRADTVTFPDVISGTGGLAQIGSGTTILNAANTFSGPTVVTSGVLAIGDPGHATAALSGGGPVTVASGATLGGYGGVAGDVTSAGTVAVANAVQAFAGGPTGTFTIGGSFQNNGTAMIAGPGVGNTLVVSQNYAAGPGATVEVATLLNEGGPLSNQVTDRLLVSGNATGNTAVVVRAFGDGADTTPDFPSAIHGISIIQVAGTSSSGAFTVPGGYVDGGTPFRYQLYAFGPGSPNGAASASQSVVSGGAQWDYRLESVYTSPVGPEPPEPPGPPEPPAPDSRPELAPQVPSYLSLPSALFNTDFQDLDSLHRRLGEIRDDSARGSPEDGEVFVRSYGDAFRYDSNRSFTQYGYNSTQDYGAIQGGVDAILRHDLNGTLRGGLFGTYGDLWLQPDAIDGASSGRFSTYTVAGALTWQSAQGWYVDGIVAGGAFYGSVDTAVRGRAANSAGNMMSASIETGYPIALGWQGLALEPQLQLVGQRLDFAPFTDADGIDVNLGSQSQGVFRAGARLLKSFATADNGILTPYLKVNLLQGIGGGGTVNLAGDPFLTGSFGTSVQVGGGVNGSFGRNFSAYGDVAWQDNASGGGFRGWAFNGGVRYAF